MSESPCNRDPGERGHTISDQGPRVRYLGNGRLNGQYAGVKGVWVPEVGQNEGKDAGGV